MIDSIIAPAYTVEHMGAHQHPQHTDLHTATLWTLHLEVPASITVQRAVLAVLTTGAEVLTGDYCGGDSFLEWCESMDDGHPDSQAYRHQRGRALHVYFTSPTLDRARLAAREILYSAVRMHRHLDGGEVLETWLQAQHAGITTAGDWSEYAEIWVHTTEDSIREIDAVSERLNAEYRAQTMNEVLDELGEFEKQWNL